MSDGNFKGWIARRPNGLYVLTRMMPVVGEVFATAQLEVYAQVGDPLAWGMPVCEHGRRSLFAVDELEPFQAAKVAFRGMQTGAVIDLKGSE